MFPCCRCTSRKNRLRELRSSLIKNKTEGEMKNIDKITKENFNESFNIVDIVSDSVFYPASGIDASDIECLSNLSNSFVHVDYSTSEEVVELGLKNHFKGVGYDLIGLKHIPELELFAKGLQPQNIGLNKHEKERLAIDFIHDRYSCRNFIPFAFWAVYELNSNKTALVDGKIKRFSLLHVGGEACATLEALYIGNKINPLAVSIISPGEGYGDNWTAFRDPECRLYQNLIHNYRINNATLPKFLLTNMGLSDAEPCFWPEYIFLNRINSDGGLQLYSIKQE